MRDGIIFPKIIIQNLASSVNERASLTGRWEKVPLKRNLSPAGGVD